MKNILSIIFAVIAWFAVFLQYYLMIENRVASISETTIRFISFFTILTNSLVAIYFTVVILKIKNAFTAFLYKPGTLTAITVYITIVGLVYQLLLRHLWKPTGLQLVADELLHSLIPILVIIYWYLYEKKSPAAYSQIPGWLIYPFVYLVFILIRGWFSDFYPYPFVNVGTIGLMQVVINSVLLMALFTGLSALFIRMSSAVNNRR